MDAMSDQAETFRTEHARLIEAAKTAKTPEARARMLQLAEKFLDLAGHQSPSDHQMARPGDTQPVVQQQQQVQPDKQKEEC
jgi:hypothetical protein